MKRLAMCLMAISLMVPLAGCPTATAPTPPLAPGYLNTADQQMGEILAGAHSFYTTIQQESVAGTLVLTPTQKTAFNEFGVSLNAAQTVYLAYHNGAATQAAAQTAVNTVQSQQAALPLPGATK